MAASAKVVSYMRTEPGSHNIPIGEWPASAKSAPSPVDVDKIARGIVDRFNSALASNDFDSMVNLFQEDGYWRDHLATTWDLRTLKGSQKILQFLKDNSGNKGSKLQRLEVDGSTAFRAAQSSALDAVGEVKGIQFFVKFFSNVGSGDGVVRLSEHSNGEWKIWTLFLSLAQLTGFEEPIGARRPLGVKHGGDPGRKNWKERRQEEENFEGGAEPTVLVIGAGQGGLTVGARLKMLNLPTLIVDTNERVGDNWRNRYHQLVLHDPIWYDQMPYIPFPSNWPVFTPKDKLGDWFEIYAKLLELNVWTSTVIRSSSWDNNARQWTVVLERTRPDGTVGQRTIHPRHIVQATGHSGKKNFPVIKGMDTFQGDLLCHSSEFPGAKTSSSGKKAIVVGACNSGHDIAQDYFEKGYHVTMVQRSSTCVVSSKAILDIGLAGLYDETGPATDDADLWLWAFPSESFKALQIKIAALQAGHDRDMLDGLRKAGFQPDLGPDDCGLFIKYFQRGGGYYIDVGASQLIIDGKIKIKSGQEIVEVIPRGLRFGDGSELEADEIIFATGFENMRSQARTIFGDAVAHRVGDVWGFDEEGEMRTIWRPSGHPGLWFHGGNLALCRYFSRMLALQIQAVEGQLA